MLAQIKEKMRNGELMSAIKKTIRNRFLVFWNSIRYANAFYFLDAERVLTRRYIKKLKKALKNLKSYSNYSLHPSIRLNEKSLVYSLGIFRDVSFDLAIANQTGCQVHLFDPTPVTKEFMVQYANHALLHYHPIGIWTENTQLTFYQGKEDTSSTVFNEDGVKKSVHFVADCKTIPTVMKENAHTAIDVLKMDIEGAALPVCKHIFEHGIFPKQIVGEFERPLKSMPQVKEFLKSIDELVNQMTVLGYSVYSLHRSQAYYSVELLAVKDSDS